MPPCFQARWISAPLIYRGQHWLIFCSFCDSPHLHKRTSHQTRMFLIMDFKLFVDVCFSEQVRGVRHQKHLGMERGQGYTSFGRQGNNDYHSNIGWTELASIWTKNNRANCFLKKIDITHKSRIAMLQIMLCWTEIVLLKQRLKNQDFGQSNPNLKVINFNVAE